MVRRIPGPVGASNTAVFVMNVGPDESWVHFVVNGPGTVRVGTSKQELETSMSGSGVDDGLPQVVADGERPRVWAGEIWAIASAACDLIVIAPKFSAGMNRGMNPSAK